ncbi:MULTISPECIES: helix-turn-helix domain-containing protein [Kitasatospora]|uniref:helix-turn-helix domain-containing protein n=1 Tax=Kitasatospora TaxID=2063 RepID=UPI0004C46E4D|nr:MULTISPECIES: helix-turn-helix domain-containing protein [unclassified Kitasatospora]WAL71974.1 helix-turn-helix domain-containing protein [Kitasatospora sp. YST-16]WNW38021.1 helix-turn-helix domain-containing protein [Streptomyces sp. Li-HN-5-13]
MSRLTEAPTLIASAQRALRLLEAAARHPSGATAKQLARDTGLALGTTYHLLRTLVHDRYLERREGRYRTGPAVSGLTGRNGPEGPAPGPSRPGGLDGLLGRIAHQLSAAVHFARYKDGEVDLVAAAPAPGAPTADPRRFRSGAHAHAAGKTLLALMSAEERRSHLARYPMVPFTPYTLREPAHLPLLPRHGPQRAAPITQYREYALDTAGAAVPLVLGGDLAAVSVALPMAQAHRLPEIAALLRARVGDDLVAAAFGR